MQCRLLHYFKIMQRTISQVYIEEKFVSLIDFDRFSKKEKKYEHRGDKVH